jgi:hypothetical protein
MPVLPANGWQCRVWQPSKTFSNAASPEPAFMLPEFARRRHMVQQTAVIDRIGEIFTILP